MEFLPWNTEQILKRFRNSSALASALIHRPNYTLLTEHMSIIREYGRYVFWKNEDRKEKYYNNYKR